MKPNKILHELEDFFSRRWNTRRDRTLVKCIQNDVSRPLPLEREHFFQAFRHCAITRLLYPTIMCRIELGEFVTTGIGSGRELDEKRGKKVAKPLLIDVPEIKIEVGHCGHPGIAQGHDILYNRRTEIIMSFSQG